MRNTRTFAALAAVTTGAGLLAVAPADAAPQTSATTCTAARMAAVAPLEVKVGQMLMVGNPATGTSSTVLAQIASYHVGNVFLSGRTTGGVAQVAAVSSNLRARATYTNTRSVRPFIATDQEGGNVQVLRGTGFSSIPTALSQGTNPGLYYSARTWAGQLKSAGVNMNLAPVADTVPSWLGRGNPPIGYWYREFGYTPSVVATYSNAFEYGMRSVGVAATAKHFPGLGLVRANTDTSSNVHDTLTSTTGAYATYLDPFRKAANESIPFIMMSSAIYDRIDPARPAVFSPSTVNGVLRSNLGFRGVVMTDDIGNAAAVSPWTYSQRAYYAVNAGVQLLLTVNPNAVPAMYNTILANARSNSVFRAKVDAAALQIFAAKQTYGLLPATC